MKKKQTESEKALEEFFNEFIGKQKAEGASPDELRDELLNREIFSNLARSRNNA